ncbi:MAG: hypothetical protein RH982_09765 [Parvibaculum sp.]
MLVVISAPRYRFPMGWEQRIIATLLAILVVTVIVQTMLEYQVISVKSAPLSWEAIGSLGAAIATAATAIVAVIIASRQTKHALDLNRRTRLQDEEDICRIIMTEVERIAWMRNRAHHKFQLMKRNALNKYDSMDVDELHGMIFFEPVIYLGVLPKLGTLRPEWLEAVVRFYHVIQRDQTRFGKWIRELPINEYHHTPSEALNLFAVSSAFAQANEMVLAETLCRARIEHFERAKNALTVAWPELTSETDETQWRNIIREFSHNRTKPTKAIFSSPTPASSGRFG